MAGWNAETAAGPLGTDTITLVEGSSFCISAADGDIHPESPHGVFVEDTRILSRWNLTINGEPLEVLAAKLTEPYRAFFVGRVPRSDGNADSSLIVERLREVGTGIVEQVTVRNYSPVLAECVVSLNVEVDFADIFEVKEARVHRRWAESRGAGDGTLTIQASWQDLSKGVKVQAPGADITPEAITYRASLPPHGHWSTVLTVTPQAEGDGFEATFVHFDGVGPSPRDRRRQEWVSKIPVLRMGNHSIERTLRRSYDDLGALRIEDPDHPDRIVVAAGAPWFMALFGRDSLWASLMALPVDPSLWP